jgi:type II secretion system protein J
VIPAARRGRAAFTLIEILLAVSLVAIIMAIAYGVVVSTVKAQERIEETTLGTEIGPVLLNQFRQDVEAAFAPDQETDWFLGQDRKGGVGDRDRLDFVSDVPSLGAEDAYAEPRFNNVNEVGYLVDDNRQRPGELVLYRREDLWIDEEPLKGGKLTAVYDRVLTFDIQYWDGEKWVESWSSKASEGSLPPAVKVVVKLLVPDKSAQNGVVARTYSITVVRPR